MSLKAFHLVFIGLSALLAFGLGVWSIHAYGVGVAPAAYLGVGLGCFGAGAGLGVYGAWFLRKMKGVSYL